jgi:Reverse transcriptase (RNA-dependent DNA polymerase)
MNNYRPISMLNVFSKIFEKIVANRLSSFLELNNLISNSQFGFHRKHSTVQPLTKFLNFISKANNANHHCLAIFCDLQKAFDTCDHCILISKLSRMGLRDIELNWFKDYLSNRKLMVSINGFNSKLLSIKIGVPQGSILGPLLFLIYINDLPLCSRFLSLLFADDTTLLIAHENFDILIQMANVEFKKVTDFFRFNKLSLHPLKTNCMIFSSNKNVL